MELSTFIMPGKQKKKLSRGQSTVNKAEMKRRNQRMTKIAQVEVAKRGIMQFRTKPEDMLALFDLSIKRGQRVSTMVREWVLERLAQESGNAPIKLDITINKEKVGSVSLASALLNVINDNAKPQKSN